MHGTVFSARDCRGEPRESRKVVDLLRRFELEISGIVVNRVIPDDLDDGAGGFLSDRREQERAYRQEIDQIFAAIPRVVVPLLRHDVHDTASVREVGRMLSKAWAG